MKVDYFDEEEARKLLIAIGTELKVVHGEIIGVIEGEWNEYYSSYFAAEFEPRFDTLYATINKLAEMIALPPDMDRYL